MAYLGFYILLSVVMILDYKMYLRGNDCIFFKDKTDLEKDLREIQKLETKKKLKELQDEII